jgi:hypothetical protein
VPPEGEVGALLPCQLEIQNLTGIPQFVTLAIQDLQGTPHQSSSPLSSLPSHHTGTADASAEPYYFHAGEMETGFMIQPRSSQVFGPPHITHSSGVGLLKCQRRTRTIAHAREQVMQHLLLPLRSGFVPLPRFALVAKRYETDIALSQALRSVFVRPAALGVSSSAPLASPFPSAGSGSGSGSAPSSSVGASTSAAAGLVTLLSSSPSLHGAATLITL